MFLDIFMSQLIPACLMFFLWLELSAPDLRGEGARACGAVRTSSALLESYASAAVETGSCSRKRSLPDDAVISGLFFLEAFTVRSLAMLLVEVHVHFCQGHRQ